MKSDLSSVKVGDKISAKFELEVIEIDKTEITHPIKLSNQIWYSIDGYERLKKNSSINDFLENPFEKGITREVEEDLIKGFIEYYNIIHDDLFHIAFGDAINYLDQKYNPLPTPEEAAEKLGITVEQLKEIVK